MLLTFFERQNYLIHLSILLLGTSVASLQLHLFPDWKTSGRNGVSSLNQLKHSSEKRIAVGSKDGGVFLIDVGNDRIEVVPGNEELQQTSKLPIYSLLTVNDEASSRRWILAGCGERYLSVWSSENDLSPWALTQRLGPHTGWVKAVAPGCDSRTVHSIGCNHIETWQRQHVTWKHVETTSTDSSTGDGVCTLSSDLLCLDSFGSQETNDFLLAAGGVDGRIHIFGVNKNGVRVLEPMATCIGHSGRVNKVCFCQQGRSLISASNDGTIRAWELKRNHKSGVLLTRQVAEHSSCTGQSVETRFTALTCLDTGSSAVRVLAGTQTGQILQFGMQFTDDSASSCTLLDTTSVSSSTSLPLPIITALDFLHDKSKRDCVDSCETVFVACTQGIGLLKMSDVSC